MLTSQQQFGFALVELMIVVIISTLIATIGVPALQRFSQNIEARQDITQLSIKLHSARAQALQHASRVTLCPLDNNNQCYNQWNAKLSAFFDKNNNHQADNNEEILFIIPAISNDKIKRAFNGSVISFDSTGFSGINTGSFSYCLKGAIAVGDVFIISRIGRIRKGTDSNNDGIPETAGGRAIPCPPQ